jgi:hypothetical protein
MADRWLSLRLSELPSIGCNPLLVRVGDISFQEYSLYAACVLGLMFAVECLALWVEGAFAAFWQAILPIVTAGFFALACYVAHRARKS